MSEPAIALQVLQPTDKFLCAHYGCTLFARACVLRQERQLRGFVGKPLTSASERVSSFCRTGQCEQGRGIREQLAGVEVLPPRPPSVFSARPKFANLEPRPEELGGAHAPAVVRTTDPTEARDVAAQQRPTLVEPMPEASTRESGPSSTSGESAARRGDEDGRRRSGIERPPELQAVRAPPPKSASCAPRSSSSPSRSDGPFLRRGRGGRRKAPRQGGRRRGLPRAARGPRREVT